MKKNIALMLLLSVVSFTSFADKVANKVPDKKVLQNNEQLVFLGVDPETQGLMYEGTSTGEIGTGTLDIMVFPFQITNSELYFSANWSFKDDDGASMTGANSGRLDLGSLAIHEKGIVLSCFGKLSDMCGCPFRFDGMASDSEFIPNLTTAEGQSSIFIEKDDDCIGKTGKNKNKHKDKGEPKGKF